MKITRQQNGSITVGFDGAFGLRQAIGLRALVNVFPASAALTLDFRRVRWDGASAIAALIPALASLHRAVRIVGVEPAPLLAAA